MGITIGPEAQAVTAKKHETWIRHSEIRASDASKEVRTACLAERASENIQFEVKEGPLHRAVVTD